MHSMSLSLGCHNSMVRFSSIYKREGHVWRGCFLILQCFIHLFLCISFYYRNLSLVLLLVLYPYAIHLIWSLQMKTSVKALTSFMTKLWQTHCAEFSGGP